LRRVFLRTPAVAAVAVLSLCAVLLSDLILAHTRQSIELRAISIARFLEAEGGAERDSARVAAFVAGSALPDAQVQVIVTGADGRVLAASDPSWSNEPVSSLPDKALVKALNEALSTGRFSSGLSLGDGRRAAILPLAPRSLLAETGAPPWIGQAGPGYHGDLVRSGFARWPLVELSLPPEAQVAGAVVVAAAPGAGPASSHDLVFAGVGIIALAIIALLAALWVACKRFVLAPVEAIEATLARQRAGEPEARIPPLSTAEFDRLARHWNSVVDDRQLSQQHERVLASVMEELPVGVAIFDAAGTPRYVNPALRAFARQAPADRAQSLLPASIDAATLGRAWSGEISLLRADASELELAVSLAPVRDATGKLEHVIGVYHDITSRKANEERLIEERQRAESAMRAKAAFISMMSHELRTPLNAVIGFAGIIANEQVGPINNPAYREFAQLIDQSATMLLSIINTIIDLNRLEKGDTRIEEEAFQPALLVERVVATQAAEIERRGVNVRIVDTSRRAALNADPRHVRKIVGQLLSNAVKFNRERDPRIVIRVRLDRQDRLSISVADTGVGIRPELVAQVTEPFFQADASMARQHGGAGLGLTLVKAVVEAMGGAFTIRSRVNRGTVVTVTFDASRTMRASRRRGRTAAKLKPQEAA
jgi:signal transduction histidine kinase